MDNNTDAELLVGVEGGDSISQGSGKLIKEQLTAIMNQIQSSDVTKINISLNMGKADEAVKKVAQDIKKTMSNIKSTAPVEILRFDNLKTQLAEAKKAFNSTFSGNSNSLGKEAQNIFSELSSAEKELSKINATSKQTQIDDIFNKVSQAIGNATSKLEKYKKSSSDIGILGTRLDTQETKLSGIKSKSNGIIEISDFNDTQSKITEARNLIGGISSGSSANIVSDYERIKQLLGEVTAEAQRYNAIVSNTNQQTRSQETQTRKMTQEQINFNNILRQAEAYYNKYASKIKKNSSINSSWTDSLHEFRDATVNPDNYNDKDTRKTLGDLIKTSREAGVEAQSASEKFKNLFGQHWDTAVVMFGVNYIKQSLRQMYQNVLEVDIAMTELKKVTDETDYTYEKFLNNAEERARNMGATLSDVIQATANASRLGYDINPASSLGDTTTIYKNVADGISDITAASEAIISPMKAFNIEAERSMIIADEYNEVGNKFAISSSGIGEAMQRSASALAAAGNSMEQSIALAVGANAVAQDPEKVGTTLKTMSMYLRAAKSEAEDAGESTDGMANSVSSLRQQILDITDQKVDIMVDDETFKTTYQQVKELSQVFNELSDVDAANLLNLMGGKRNASVISGLLNNFGDSEKALEVASNASGSALRENEKYLDSIDGKMKQFQANFQSMSVSTIDNGAVKFFIDMASAIVSGVDGLSKMNALLPVIIAGFLSLKSHVGKPKSSNMPAYAPLQKCA